MIQKVLYLSDECSLQSVQSLTGLAIDELESLVGRFAKHSHRAGLLRGKLVIRMNGSLELRKSFGNKLIAKLEKCYES